MKIFKDLYGANLSDATLIKTISNKAKEMTPFTDTVQEILSGDQSAVKHLDETGFRVAGKTRWIHVRCSVLMSHFRLGISRGDVPTGLLGKAMHDCFSSNWTLEDVEHGVCSV